MKFYYDAGERHFYSYAQLTHDGKPLSGFYKKFSFLNNEVSFHTNRKGEGYYVPGIVKIVTPKTEPKITVEMVDGKTIIGGGDVEYPESAVLKNIERGSYKIEPLLSDTFQPPAEADFSEYMFKAAVESGAW